MDFLFQASNQGDLGSSRKRRPPSSRKSIKGEDDGTERITGLFAQQNLHDAPTEKLQELSLEERNQALHELHGVSDEVDETPELLEQKLKEMELELALSPMYQQARSQNAKYVDSLKLMFLRSERMDASKAVVRLGRFFLHKLKLFGPDIGPGEEITAKHLSETDLDALRSGFIQCLAQRDRAGRTIMLMYGPAEKGMPARTIVRLLYVVCMTALKDETVQRRGVIMMYYGIGRTQFRTDTPPQVIQTWSSLPLRITAVHAVYDNPILHAFMSLVANYLESNDLCRTRGHYGSHLECIYNLMTYGIPKHVLPFDDIGNISLKDHKEFVDKFLHSGTEEENNTYHATTLPMDCSEVMAVSPTPISRSSSTSTTHTKTTTPSSKITAKPGKDTKTTTPTTMTHTAKTTTKPGKESSGRPLGPLDIPMGRGRHALNTPGHLKFKAVCAEYHPKYDASSKIEKVEVSKLALKQLKGFGCRFVKKNLDGAWVEVDDHVSRERIAHAFRNLRRDVESSNASRIGKKRRKPGIPAK